MASSYPGPTPTPTTGRPWEKYRSTPSPVAGPRIGAPITPARIREPTPQTADQAALTSAQLGEAQRNLQTTAAGGGVNAAVEQRKAAGFYSQAQNSNQHYNDLHIGPRGYFESMAADFAPDAMHNFHDSAARQQAEAYQRDFIASTLRYESGAAIPPAELESQRRRYFPQSGASQEEIDAKAQLRQQAIESLRIGGGAASTLVHPNAGEPKETQRDPLFGKGRIMGSDEEGHFNMDGPAPPRGQRFSPAVESQIIQAIKDGDVGQAAALTEKYTGHPADRAGLAAAAAAYRKDPRTPLYVSYSGADQLAQDEYDKERYGDYLKPAMEDRAKFGHNVDSGLRQAANSVTLGLADPVEAGASTIFGGGAGNTLSERFRDNLRQQRAITEADFRVNPVSSYAGAIVGGLAVPTKAGAIGDTARLEALTGGDTLRRAVAAGRGAGARRLGLEGVVYGGIRGTADNIESPNRLGYGLAGAGTGGTLGYGIGRALGGRLPKEGNGLSVAQAAEQEGIPVGRPVVDPSARNSMAYLDASVGGGPIRTGLNRSSQALEERVGALGNGGTALDEAGIGGQIQGAGRRFIQSSGNRARALYDRASELAGGSKVSAENAVQALDSQIADLSRNPNSNAPLLKFMNEIKSDFVDESGQLIPKDVSAIRDLRTGLRGQISNRNLTMTDAERRIGQVLDAAGTDVQRDLGNSAPEAMQAFSEADQFYKGRQDEIKNVVQRVLGNSRREGDQISPEKAWQAIRAMAGPKGDVATLGRIWGKLSNEEAHDAAATLAESFGRRSPDEPFSPTLFVNSVRGLSPRARETLFGPSGARSIENLKTVAEALRDTTARLNNSRSGQVQQYGQFFKNIVPHILLGGGGGALVGGAPGAAVGAMLMGGAGLAARNASARMMMSPAYSRWLVQLARAETPSQFRVALQRVATVATRDPAVAQQAFGVHDDLQKALGDRKQTSGMVTVKAGMIR